MLVMIYNAPMPLSDHTRPREKLLYWLQSRKACAPLQTLHPLLRKAVETCGQ